MANTLKKAFGASSVKEEEGVWIDLNEDISIKIRRYRSRAAQEAAKEFSKEYAGPKNKKLTTAQTEELTTKVLAKSIIADWKGVEDDDGPIPCTFENKFKILNDPEMNDFREFVANASYERDVFAIEADEDATGN